MKTEQHAAPSGPVFTSVREVEASIKTRMEKALSDLQHDMATIRTGRASLSILDNLRVDYYGDRKSTRLNSSHLGISYAVFCLKKKKTMGIRPSRPRNSTIPPSATGSSRPSTEARCAPLTSGPSPSSRAVMLWSFFFF